MEKSEQYGPLEISFRTCFIQLLQQWPDNRSESDISKSEDEIKISWIVEYHANNKKQQEDLTSVFGCS